ncbi:hypothetical protein N0V83_002291 [Neocucurbitaria cava]|uniref:Transcription factor IIIC subunit delta N-term-domain-containing protein n=1 Tax=Neocucurbitaria cava TaxID=798079 RepID=A0A9W8YDT5_9PLEO|nr:hypothetical protein N0V83_002291 [Neocucurbitaria cava]
MTDVTEFKCWPSCVDAIDWSQDGIIALASDERVELLFPNTVSFDRDQDAPQWQHVSLRVPLFSSAELAVKEPSPLSAYSIGEEISSSVPIAIAWSSPGLAKHQRCALATLTTNLVLSIWSADGKPQEESSWSRRLIVNHALKRYFLSSTTNESINSAPTSKEQMRLSTRVRAFAWAPALPCSGPNGIIGTRLSYDQHIIAVATDNKQVVFVVVDSPTSTLGVNQGWSAEVRTHFALTPDSESCHHEPIFFEDMMKQQTHISHITWSPWVHRDKCYRSVVVYATNKDVRARTITYTDHRIELGAEIVYQGIQLRYDGPLKWYPEVQNGSTFRLALFTGTGLVYLTISAHDASIIKQVVHELDGRCDLISATAWDIDQQRTVRLHFSSLLSTLQSPTAVLEVSSGGLTSLPSPNWRDQIENNLVLFSVKNDLKGNSKAKVWGLTTSPLGDFIAACSSVHPSDMIEYGPPSERRGTIAISNLRLYSELRKSFPVRHVSAEGIIFTVKKLVENTVEESDQMPAFATEIQDKLMQAYPPCQDPNSNYSILATYRDASDLIALLNAFKKITFLNVNTLRDRYTILLSQACNIASSNMLPRTLIAHRLATALQHLPSSLFQTPFSAEIFAHHRQLISLVDSLIKPDNSPSELTENLDVANNVSRQSPVATVDDTTARTDPATLGEDTCDFCSAPIPFTDPTSAICTKGHQFPRCGLSLLPIQAPGITKYCGICSTPFLSEEFVTAQEVEVQEEFGRFTLSRVLFLACDVCIYCGGKYVE